MNIKGLAELLKDVEKLKEKAKEVKVNAEKKLGEVEASSTMKEVKKDKWDEYIESVLDITDDIENVEININK